MDVPLPFLKTPQIYFLLFALVSLINSTVSADNNGRLQGTVYNYNTSEPVSQVIVRIEGTKLSGHSDNAGFFQIADVPPGKYSLLCLKAQFYCTMSDPVEIFGGQTCEVKLNMLPGDPEKFLYISIGGITVTADRELIPESHETVHKITSAEIEHMQATNLGDILDLIPGVERQNRPGLAAPSFVTLRGTDVYNRQDFPDIFGSKIVVDEIPLSKNVNLNEGEGVGYGSNVRSSAEMGVDLRGVVADNIQEVEVVSGVPSVEYGDLTTGILKVTTRTGPKPLRFKIKTNPDTREFNLNGGNPLFTNLSVNYNFNYAYSERNIRQDGDEASRVSGQLNLDYLNKSSGFNWKNRFFYSGLFEDYYLPEDPQAPKVYGKDYSLNFGTVAEKRLKKLSKVNFTGFLNYTRRKNYTRRFQVIDPTYVTGRTTAGTQEAVLLADPYFWEVNTTGDEFSVGLKIKMEQGFFIGKMLHSFLYGIEYTFEDNVGQGKQFDPLRPPGGNTGVRPRSFNDVPGFAQLSLFLEDRITSKLVVPYTLSLGIRGEMYNPVKFGGNKIVRSRNGTFWNPRMGIQVKPAKKFQIRSSYGLTSKAPPLYYLYPDPLYYDVLEWGRDPNSQTGLDSIPLVTTYVYPQQNENLQGYVQKKFEFGIDFQIKDVGISLTGYRQRTDGTIWDTEIPYLDRRYRWPNWPSSEGKILVSEEEILLNNYGSRSNIGWNIREGAELTIRTHRISQLNMMFRIGGSFNFKRYGFDNLWELRPSRNFTEYTADGDTINHRGFPMMPRTSGWNKSLIMSYNLDYINNILGVWITFTMFHKIYDQGKAVDIPSAYNYAVGYYEDGSYNPVTTEQAAEWKLYDKPDEGNLIVYRYPASFYFNLTVSKNIWKGMEISLFVNNFLNTRLFYTDRLGDDRIANPEIFYGMEFSMILDPLTRYMKGSIF
jgi:hypothetical protein